MNVPLPTTSAADESDLLDTLRKRVEALDDTQFRTPGDIKRAICSLIGPPPATELSEPDLTSRTGTSSAAPITTTNRRPIEDSATPHPSPLARGHLILSDTSTTSTNASHGDTRPYSSSHGNNKRVGDLFSPVSFSNLPNEILHRIVFYASYGGGYAYWDLKRKKALRLTGRQWGLEGVYYGAYNEKDEEPILSSFQSLASTSKKMHEMCRPHLWKKLNFPSMISAPVYHWTRTLLLKHGHLVQSVRVDITLEWFGDDPIAMGSFYDNRQIVASGTSVSDGDPHRGLSQENLTKILIMCPNIRSLSVIVPCARETDYEEEDLNRVLGRLQQMVSRLKNLESFGLWNCTGSRCSDEFPIGLVRSLPSLKSLQLNNFSLDRSGHHAEPFDCQLLQLKNLSSLELKYFAAPISKWWAHSLPTRLTSLELDHCDDLLYVDGHQLVSRLASQLIHLRLRFRDLHPPLDHGVGPTWAQTERFNMPLLTSLNIDNPTTYDLFPSVQGCKNLRVLRYASLAPSEWKSCQDLICAATWTYLKEFMIDSEQPYDRNDWDICSAQINLKRYCHENDICFTDDFD